MNIFYWKDALHKEVDFVVKEGSAVTGLIQVCSDPSDRATRTREFRSLLKAMEEFGLKEGLVLTEEEESEESADGRKILFFPIWKWLLESAYTQIGAMGI